MKREGIRIVRMREGISYYENEREGISYYEKERGY